MSFHIACPPPPPLPVANIVMQSKQAKNTLVTQFPLSDTDCCWAVDYPELRLACGRFRLCLRHPPYSYRYQHVESLLQEGPTCGLVALSMILKHAVSPSALLALARNNKISNNGELFHVKWVVQLLDEITKKSKIEDLIFEIKNTRLFCKEIVELLLDGCMLLVPYDCDKNHTPCLKKGHKAHWAVITGIVIEDQIDHFNDLPPEKIHVTAKHGKSSHVAVWRLCDLDKSNNNLEEFAPEREDDNLEYILPQGGLTAGLKGQFIILYPSKSFH